MALRSDLRGDYCKPGVGSSDFDRPRTSESTCATWTPTSRMFDTLPLLTPRATPQPRIESNWATRPGTYSGPSRAPRDPRDPRQAVQKTRGLDKNMLLQKLQLMGAHLSKFSEVILLVDSAPDREIFERVHSLLPDLLAIVEGVAATCSLRGEAYVSEKNRLRQKIAERDHRLAALEHTFLAYLSEREETRLRVTFLQRVVLRARLSANQHLLVNRVLHSWSDSGRRQRGLRKKEAVLARNTVGDQRVLLETVLNAWCASSQQGKLQQQLGNALLQAQLVAKARDRAIATFKRTIGAASEDLKFSSFCAWREAFIDVTRNRERRAILTKRMGGVLAGVDQETLITVCAVWRLIAEISKATKREKQSVHRTTMFSSTLVIRARARLVLRLGFALWYIRTNV